MTPLSPDPNRPRRAGGLRRAWARRVAAALLAALVSGPVGAGKEDALPEFYRDWLRQVAEPIITLEEREEFVALSSPEQLDTFIERFWRRRDPIPESPLNEYRENYERLLLEADRKFGGETPRRGRLTERGRIYVALGPPDDILVEPSSADFYPYEIWYYDRLDAPGLPPSLRLMFFKRKGAGEYRLYSPAFDGPRELTPIGRLQASFENPRYRLELERALAGNPRLSMELKEAMVGIAPGFNPLASEEVLFRLRQAPLEREERFGSRLESRIETRYTFKDPFSMRGAAVITHGRDLEYQVDLVVEIPPDALTAREEEERTYLRVDFSGRIEAAQGMVVKSIQDSAAFDFSAAEFESARRFPLRYAARAFLLPGDYVLDLLVRNYTDGSVGHLRQPFTVPAEGGSLSLTPPSFGGLPRTIEGTPGPYQPEPLRCDRLRLQPEADQGFAPGQPLFAFLEIADTDRASSYSLRYELLKGGAVVWTGQDQLGHPQVGPRGSIPVLRPLDSSTLAAGGYQLQIQLRASDGRSVASSGAFEIVESEPPVGTLEAFAPAVESPAQFHLEIAQQHLLAGNLDQARFHAENALAFEPGSTAARLLSAKVQLRAGEIDSAIAALKRLGAEGEPDSEVLATIAYALSRKGDFQASAASYRAAIAASSVSSPTLLNALGDVLRQAGDHEGARQAFEDSLRLDPNQPAVESALAALQ